MKLKSVFEDNGFMPAKYTCDAGDNNPEFVIEDVPEKTKSFAMTMEDRDSPIRAMVHWIIFNIPADIREIKENNVPQRSIHGTNDFGKQCYKGPCPDSAIHRYEFKLFALDRVLEVDERTKKAELANLIKGRTLAEAVLTGLYSRD
ncbi:MAG: YbhB/YbcL family Raf kinase inhibitor-like protein [Thermodesulfobacteriota bacterium]|nr:YbhB/YbcL family Raf kinase inhibitor-like protein [Thermodesulfobacteriota bacterium]